MRFPSIPTIIRSFSIYNFSVARNNWPAAYKGLQSPVVRNSTVSFMPTIPFLSGFFGQQKDMTNYPVKKSDDQWQAKLSSRQFEVLRNKDTEAAFTGQYDKHMPSEGTYVGPFARDYSCRSRENLTDNGLFIAMRRL